MKTFEQAEQKSLQDLEKCYRNYLRFQQITDLQHTAINTYNDFDATAISADTKLLIIEYKRRNISINQYQTTIIEYEKFMKLKKYWLCGNTPIYLIELYLLVSVYVGQYLFGVYFYAPLEHHMDSSYAKIISNQNHR